MSEPTAPNTTTTGEKGTQYVILHSDGAGWKEYDQHPTATSAEAAIRLYITKLAEAPTGRLVAVPLRSWKPVKVTVETKQTVKLG
jgi:hypothetical protein